MSRKILIYGATGGIGSATARNLKAGGCDLHLVARDGQRLAQLAGELGAGYTAGDANDTGLFTRVEHDIGDTLDGLVYAIGTINLRSLKDLDEKDFEQDFRLNALGAALAVKTALPALKKSPDGASVVLYSSVAAHQGFTFHSSMSMAKCAVEGLVLALAAELAPRVRVNAIAPSLTDTPLAKKILKNEQTAAAITRLHALQRIGTPDDIASLTGFLLSDDASWITGQVMKVDGGRSTLRARG